MFIHWPLAISWGTSVLEIVCFKLPWEYIQLCNPMLLYSLKQGMANDQQHTATLLLSIGQVVQQSLCCCLQSQRIHTPQQLKITVTHQPIIDNSWNYQLICNEPGDHALQPVHYCSRILWTEAFVRLQWDRYKQRAQKHWPSSLRPLCSISSQNNRVDKHRKALSSNSPTIRQATEQT